VCEIEELDAPADEPGYKNAGQRQKAGQTELDALLEEDQVGADGPNWKQQMWHGFVDSSKQAVRALCMLAIMYILMWSFGLLPTQSEEFMAGRSAAVTQPAAAAAVGGGPEDG